METLPLIPLRALPAWFWAYLKERALMAMLTHAEWLKPFFCLAVGFLTCLGLIPLILQWADYHGGPNRGRDFHHAHALPVARLGGVALAAAFAVVVMVIHYSGSLSAAGARILDVIDFSSLAIFALR